MPIMFLLHLTQHLVTSVPLLSVAQSLLPQHIYAAAAPPADAFGQLEAFASSIQGFLLKIGITIFVIGVIIAGMMRMMSFGSDRRVAVSNMALTAAVVGLIIMLLATTLSGMLSNAFK
jgi:type IV secretory pathway VirB2 component (pilin)